MAAESKTRVPGIAETYRDNIAKSALFSSVKQQPVIVHIQNTTDLGPNWETRLSVDDTGTIWSSTKRTCNWFVGKLQVYRKHSGGNCRGQALRKVSRGPDMFICFDL
jgi:hypothetical protein